MKETVLSVALVFVFYGGGLAQTGKSEFEIVKSVFNTEKTNYIGKMMDLTDEEKEIFRPIYEDYEIDRAKFSGKRWDVLQAYAAKYGTISDAEARDYMNDLLRFQKREQKLKNKYFRLLSNKLSPAKAARFIQLEEYVNSKVKYAILSELSFVQD